MDPDWRRVVLACTQDGDGAIHVTRKEQPPMHPDLLALFDLDELKKYFTAEELPGGTDPR
jgi:succinate dehydrogenase / fumarate reductase flavoprotein subunit